MRLWAAGRPHDAERHLRDALAILDGASGVWHRERSAVLNNLSLVAMDRGDPALAKQWLLRSLEAERSRRRPGRRALAITYDNLGFAELDLARRAGPYDLGGGYVNTVASAHLRDAEQHFTEAGKRFRLLPFARDDRLTWLVNRAECAELRGDAELFDQLTRRAHRVARRRGVSPLGRLAAATQRGRFLLEYRDRPDAAIALMRPLLDVAEEVEQVPIFLTVLLRAAASVGDADLVATLIRRIERFDSAVLPRRLARASEEEARHLFLGFAQRLEWILGCHAVTTTCGILPVELMNLLLNRKGVLAERQGAAWLAAQQAGETAAQVRRLRADLARADLDGADRASIEQARLARAEIARRAGEAEVRLHFALGHPWVPHVTVDAVRAALGDQSTLVELTTLRRPGRPAHYAMILLPAEGEIRYRDLGPVTEVNERIVELVRLSGTPPKGDEDRSARLRDVAVALRIFDEDDELSPCLMIAPTGRWGSVPFGLLPGPDGEPLIERHIVGLVPSGRFVARRHGAVRPASGPPLVLGDPDFDLGEDSLPDFLFPTYSEPLPNTGREAAAVAAMIGADPVTGPDATRHRLLSARSPRILHLATHGMFLTAIGSHQERAEPRLSVMRSVGGVVISEPVLGDPRMPDDRRALYQRRSEWLLKIGPTGPSSRSVLCLAGYNVWQSGGETPAEMGSGMVSATEFALLDLAGTELVVLSACETGVGAVDHADGSLLGLRTAALAAGAACCVSSLWKVPDAATADLMTAFYGWLAEGRNAAAALRRAQLAIRETHPDPYYWAGWVAEGLSRTG
ncbi:CHAT domain-containing protein [Paractinoplanes deccanensis]|nr:CHAT domain-containing tetratricopeptide repeat protein [Actinoplanes deccanensis]